MAKFLQCSAGKAVNNPFTDRNLCGVRCGYPDRMGISTTLKKK
jgi:hypothetical protein